MLTREQEAPFGHVATVERRRPWSADANGHGAVLEQIEVRRAGRRSAVEYAARLTSGFVRIVEIQAYTREQWVRVFGLNSRRA